MTKLQDPFEKIIKKLTITDKKQLYKIIDILSDSKPRDILGFLYYKAHKIQSNTAGNEFNFTQFDVLTNLINLVNLGMVKSYDVKKLNGHMREYDITPLGILFAKKYLKREIKKYQYEVIKLNHAASTNKLLKL